MSEKVCVTHPDLTPAHDFQCLPAALGTWMASGWQVREDQADPAESDPAAGDEPSAPSAPDKPARPARSSKES